VSRLAAAEAREQAILLVRALTTRDPGLAEVGGIGIGPALEQQLFFALRDGWTLPGTASRLVAGSAGLARLVAASAASTLSRLVPPPDGNPITVLVRDPIHYVVLTRLADELWRLAGRPLVMLRVGRAASVRPSGNLDAPRLANLLDPSQVPVLVAFQARVAARLSSATATWPESLRHVAARELPRIALGALALSGVAHRWRPSLLVALDEVGTWARLLPEVGRRHGVPSLDLPHAEAADMSAIAGASYDRMAVYGERAAAALELAGIGRDRIVQIGAPRFDALLAKGLPPLAPATLAGGNLRRVIHAAQYVTGRMTASVMAECERAAFAVAAVAAPAELVVVPHPADPSGSAPAPAPIDHPGVTVRMAHQETLQELLPGAWAMVTGWSNSVFEAAIASVPSITVDPGGVAPVDFAAAELALGADGAAAAAEIATSILDEDVRQAAIGRARDALPAHIGPPDGCATQRAARLMLEMAGIRVGPPG
jgi:hypothetical protein